MKWIVSGLCTGLAMALLAVLGATYGGGSTSAFTGFLLGLGIFAAFSVAIAALAFALLLVGSALHAMKSEHGG